MSLTTRLKRIVRPLLPDRLVARRRLRQHSLSSRVNVDVFLGDEREARVWLDATPDTYRVRFGVPGGTGASDIQEVADGEFEAPDSHRQRALEAITDPDIDAVAVADVAPPRLVNRRRAEPEIGPRLIVTTREALHEVGGVPPGIHPLPGLWAQMRDAGLRLGLVPLPPGNAPIRRTDPIDRPSAVVLSAVPIHDIGGGSRSAQLALELVKQGFHVTYVSLYEAQESTDLGIRFVSSNLEQQRATRFEPRQLSSRVSQRALALVEAPAPLLGQHGLELQGLGWRLVYDMIDDWSDPALGGDWFDAVLEHRLVDEADLLIASAQDLVERTRNMGGQSELVPNAVNTEIFGPESPTLPSDLPDVEAIIGYHGSLYGDWFDWDGLRRIAVDNPHAAVVVIGDDKVERPEMPPNVHFLGLKAQTDLPAYIQRFDVGIIPFKVTKTTHAVSPLKAYEYLASGVPVAAPPLRALRGLEGVFTGDLKEAVRAANSAGRPDRLLALEQHSWSNRVDVIMKAIGSAGAEETSPSARTVVRNVKHWPREKRQPY